MKAVPTRYRFLLALLVMIDSGVLSCSDAPTAPRPQASVGTVTVKGSITDRDGPALVNFIVAFRPFQAAPNQPTPWVTAITDVNGSFQVALAPGLYKAHIGPSDQSLFDVSIPKFEVGAAGSRFDYRYSGTRVTGEVTGPDGSLLVEALVTVAAKADGEYVDLRAVGGHYSILLPPGEYDLYGASGTAYSGIPSTEVEADISASDTLINLALTGHVLTGMVTLGGSAPLANVRVYAQSDASRVQAFAKSGLDGSAVLYLPSGGYSLTAFPPDGVIGPETAHVSISGDASIPIDFPGTRWNVTLRRTAYGSAVPSASILAREIGSNRSASTSADLFGKFQLFVRPNVAYDLLVGSPPFITIPNLSSTADSTFDLFVDVPTP